MPSTRTPEPSDAYVTCGDCGFVRPGNKPACPACASRKVKGVPDLLSPEEVHRMLVARGFVKPREDVS